MWEGPGQINIARIYDLYHQVLIFELKGKKVFDDAEKSLWNRF